MRVSENTSFNRAIEYVRKSKENLEKSQEKVGLLRRINKPSDDPIGMVRLLKLRGEKNKIEDLGKNIEDAKTFLGITDASLAQAGDLLIRAKELALQQAGDVGTSEITRRTVAEEISQVYRQLTKIANTKYAGRYIFSGYKTDTSPFNHEGDYFGDDGEIDVEVANEVFLPINLPGNLVFQGENRVDGNEGVDMFYVLNKLNVGLNTNDSKTIQDTLDDFDRCIDQNVLYRARIGARLNSLDRMSQTHLKADMDMLELISKIEDADVYKEFSDLKKHENILQTTLAASSKVIRPSLMDFLR